MAEDVRLRLTHAAICVRPFALSGLLVAH